MTVQSVTACDSQPCNVHHVSVRGINGNNFSTSKPRSHRILVVHHSRGRASLGVLLSASLVPGVSCKIPCFSFEVSLTTGKVSVDDSSHTRWCCMGREALRHFSLYRQLRQPRERPESGTARVPAGCRPPPRLYTSIFCRLSRCLAVSWLLATATWTAVH